MDAVRFLLSFIFPPTAEAELVARITDAEFDALLLPHTIDGVLTLVSYTDERIRALVWQAKYRKDPRALALIGRAFTRAVEGFDPSIPIVPIPLSTRRMRERGYNQVEEALRESVARDRVRTEILVRSRDTIPQTHLSRTARLTNLVGAFAVPAHAKDAVRGSDVLVVDDVLTTGATLREASRALTQAGARSVHRIAFARS